MAVYIKKFENFYELDLKSEIGGIETIDVKGKTTLNYTQGLTIDATGKTFYRKAKHINTKAPEHKVQYQTSETHGYLQAGYATINFQANRTNVAIAGWKNETSTSYNLAGGLFFNPSPIKVTRNGAHKRDHRRIHEYHVVLRKKKDKQKVRIDSSCTLLYQLHMYGL